MTPLLRSDWDGVCAQVRREEESFFHDPWLDRLAFVDADDETIVLATPNRLYVEFIQDNLEPKLLRCLEEQTSRSWKIRYELDSDLAPERHRAPVEDPRAAQAPPPPDPWQFKINADQTFSSFIVGSGNQFASAACQNVADQPAANYNPLFIFGGTGLGKTHLLNAIGNRILERNPSARIIFVSAEDFTNDMVDALRFKRMEDFREKYRLRCDVLLMDDIHVLAGRERTQAEFFHTFNALHDSGRQIVVTADRYPKDIEGLEERLRNRLDWGLVADIQPPDTETKVAILRKKADDEGIELPSEVAFFIARYTNGNIRELEGTLTRLLAMSHFHAAEITQEFARSCLDSYLSVDEPTSSADSIMGGVARFFNVKLADLKGPRRNRQIVMPRQIAMYLIRQHAGLSLPDIGRKFGGRDHTTAIHAIRKVQRQIEADSVFRKKMDLIVRTLGLPVARA